MKKEIALKYFIVTILLLAALSETYSQELKSVRPNISFENLQISFSEPDMIFAPFAFWFWDTNLDTSFIAKRADEMSEKGLNPGYVHGRIGLPPEQWLSSSWFESYTSALKQAKFKNTYLGYCDEYLWPSGRANGKVLEKNPDLRAVLGYPVKVST